MKKLLCIVARHLARYAIGYGIGLFLLIAAITCGALQGKSMELTAQLSAWSVLRIVLCEVLFLTGLLLCATHPFGCALSAGMLLIKGLLTGLGMGWWFGLHGGTPLAALLFFAQALLGSAGMLCACCVAAYHALRVLYLSRREYIRCMLVIFMVQMLCVLMRCTACAWAI